MSEFDVIERLDCLHRVIGASLRQLFEGLIEAERAQVWVDSGARGLGHWLAMRYDISEWKARRWIAAAHALERLPRIAEGLATGALGVDKVVELARFATP
jgi:hypothetical protein